MIVYSGTKSQFQNDVMTNDIGNIIYSCYSSLRANVAGTRQNKIVLVQHSSIADPDTGGSYTVKKYTSKKNYAADGAWQHEEIVLKPLNPAYADIVIPNAEAEDFMVVAEVVGKVSQTMPEIID